MTRDYDQYIADSKAISTAVLAVCKALREMRTAGVTMPRSASTMAPYAKAVAEKHKALMEASMKLMPQSEADIEHLVEMPKKHQYLLAQEHVVQNKAIIETAVLFGYQHGDSDYPETIVTLFGNLDPQTASMTMSDYRKLIDEKETK